MLQTKKIFSKSMSPAKPHRRGRPRSPQILRPNLPHTIILPDGRTLFVEIPGRWTTTDRDGSTLLLPDAIRFVDRLRALAAKIDHAPTPGFITTLREALGLTQSQLGAKLAVDKITISRWERGELRPSPKSLAALEKFRNTATAHGVILPG